MSRRAKGQVVVYKGARGTVFRARFRDAGGQRVCKTLDGATTMREAEERLEEILVDVRREGLRKLEPVTLETFAREWLDTYPEKKGLKRSTVEGYTGIIDVHLVPAFGTHRLESIDVAMLDRYVTRQLRADYAPRTVNRHLNLLHELFKSAQKQGLVRANPVSAVDRPREPDNEWTILSPVEIGRVERAFCELVDEATGEERAWREQARVVFLTVFLAGLRRGEILGLRWRHVALTDPDGPRVSVEETWVRGGVESPKSKKSKRTFALGERLAAELFDHRMRSAFQGDDERVFCSQTGGAIDPKRYGDTFRLALKRAKVDRYMRPFHDGRHTSITNSAAAGMEPMTIQKRAGHSAFTTTQIYINLAGETFPEAAELLEARMLGEVGHKVGHK
jgi:integrase